MQVPESHPYPFQCLLNVVNQAHMQNWNPEPETTSYIHVPTLASISFCQQHRCRHPMKLLPKILVSKVSQKFKHIKQDCLGLFSCTQLTKFWHVKVLSGLLFKGFYILLLRACTLCLPTFYEHFPITFAISSTPSTSSFVRFRWKGENFQQRLCLIDRDTQIHFKLNSSITMQKATDKNLTKVTVYKAGNLNFLGQLKNENETTENIVCCFHKAVSSWNSSTLQFKMQLKVHN